MNYLLKGARTGSLVGLGLFSFIAWVFALFWLAEILPGLALLLGCVSACTLFGMWMSWLVEIMD